MMIEATIYWDTQDPTNEGWAYRVRFDDGGTEESGEWDHSIDRFTSTIADAVVDLAYQHGRRIRADEVVIEELCGSWLASEGLAAD